MTINERAQHIYNVVRAAGITHAGAIGLLGNLQGEASDFDSQSVEGMSNPNSYLRKLGLTEEEYTRRADSGVPTFNGKYFVKDSTGYGIVQWTWWARKKNLLDFAKSRGVSVGDLDMQIAFMLKELQTQYTPTWKILTTTDSIAKAVQICVTNYEKPDKQSEAIARRTGYANSWAKLIINGTTELEKPNPTEPEDKNDSFDRKKLIACALAEVGYIEKRNATMLDDKIANAGSANYTKYARDLDNIGNFYNGKKQGYAWCDVFVDWNFVQCYGVDNALKLLCTKRQSSGAGCTYSLNYYIAAGQFVDRKQKPEVGDQIFFGNIGNSNHTGLVYKIDDNLVYTIEGNTSEASGVVANGGCVCKKSYPIGSSAIAGYGRPKYNDGFVGNSVEDSTTIPVEPSHNTTKEYPELSLHDKGESVKLAQKLLIKKGYSCGSAGADGEFGQDTYNAVIAFQKANGLDADGVIGENTWTKLLANSNEEDKPVEPKKDNVPAPTPSKAQFDRQILLDVAYNEIGYLEKKTESQLDDKEANAGQANFNKYAKDLDAIKNYYYHDRKQGLNWCDIFCDWCFVTAYGVNDSFTVNCQPQYSYGAGCPQSLAYYKAQGRLDMIPQVGDQFFLSDGMGSTGHTGLVVGVSNTMVDTIEGNQWVREGVEGVVKKKRLISEMAGFGHPMYNDGYGTDDYIGKKTEPDLPTPTPDPEEPIPEPTPDEPTENTPKFAPPTLKRGDKGKNVKKLQALLKYNGFSIGWAGIDGSFGSATEKAIKKVQAKLGRKQDGIADQYIWAYLISE